MLQLRELGIGEEILLWMMYQAHVQHLRPGPKGRNRAALRPAATLHLESRSAFLLTDLGEQFANDFLADVLLPAEDGGAFEEAQAGLLLGLLVPRYEKEERVFRWGRQVLKCFRQAAANQETVLTAAEELGWPAWFDDPLPRRRGTNPKALLHTTTMDLNRRQVVHLIHFKGDGSGTRIGWDYC